MSTIAVFGATGYSGAEAVRLLAGHPALRIGAVGAHERAGKLLAEVHPHLAPLGDLELEALDAGVAGRVDAALLALPHGRSSTIAPALVEAGVRVVDLAGDFRLPTEAYPTWYGFEHPAEAWLGKAAYGLPELFADRIAGADLVANPGCYPTAVALALGPLASSGLLPGHVVVDAKSGVSGAGASPSAGTHFPRTDGSVRPYRIGSHQHTPEIEHALALSGGAASVTFVPHLVPMSRGLLATCYLAGADPAAIRGALAGAYEDSPFVRLLPDDEPADPKRVAGSNACEIGVAADARTETVVITAALDNLVKGAAGQAIQNLNVMFGLDQSAGLPTVGVYP